MSMLIRLAPATAALLFTLTLQLDAQIDRITGKNFATRSEVLARHGMVCTSVPLATQVGLDILKRGGSAVDAAIAANATLGLMEPVSNGIGGDLFAIVYSAKENKLYGINGSGRSPLGLSYETNESGARETEARDDPAASGCCRSACPVVSTRGRSCTKNSGNSNSPTISRRDSLCGGRFSRHRADRLLLGIRSAPSTKVARSVFSKPTRSMAKGARRPRATSSRIPRSPTRCA